MLTDAEGLIVALRLRVNDPEAEYEYVADGESVSDGVSEAVTVIVRVMVVEPDKVVVTVVVVVLVLVGDAVDVSEVLTVEDDECLDGDADTLPDGGVDKEPLADVVPLRDLDSDVDLLADALLETLPDLDEDRVREPVADAETD